MRCHENALLWVSSPLALDAPSLRVTFTLQAWFRHARSTAFDLYLNHKSRLHAVPSGVFWAHTVLHG
jgi:hypothetical protein